MEICRWKGGGRRKRQQNVEAEVTSCVVRFRNVALYEVQTKTNERKSTETLYIRLQLQFIIHFLPVSSGFHIVTRTFHSLLRIVYALPTAQGNCSTNAQLSSVLSRMTRSASRLLDHGYNAVAMTLGLAAMLCPGFCTGCWQKRS